MPRANRHYIPGQVWHITHRCHKKEFLLKFRSDRQRWQHWLFEAKKRYGLQVLNYIATSNHIHLLTIDDGDREVLPRSMQLIASRTGQQYNQRKSRQGPFWEDRYHATAIESGEHFIRCMVYIVMNMVRAGVVNHPAEWPDCGYHEIQDPSNASTIINRQKLAAVAMLGGVEGLKVLRFTPSGTRRFNIRGTSPPPFRKAMKVFRSASPLRAERGTAARPGGGIEQTGALPQTPRFFEA